MRTQFEPCKSRKTAKKRMPWASVIAKADGGYMGFESIDDFRTWRRQK